MNKTVIIAAAVITLSGCLATNQLYVPAGYVSEDTPAEKVIRLRYTNKNRFDVCFDQANWPNQAGEVDSAKDRVFIRIGEKSYSMRDIDPGYCPGCVTRVRPGEEIVGKLPYGLFELPPHTLGPPKKLYSIQSRLSASQIAYRRSYTVNVSISTARQGPHRSAMTQAAI